MSLRHFQIESNPGLFHQRLTGLISTCSAKKLILPFGIRKATGRVDIFEWLTRQKKYPLVYWADREGTFEIAGSGVGFDLKTPNNVQKLSAELVQSAEPAPIFLFARQFDKIQEKSKPGSLWQAYPKEITFIPRVACIRHRSEYSYQQCLSISSKSEIDQVMTLIDKRPNVVPSEKILASDHSLPEINSVCENPDFESWANGVKQVLKAISQGPLEKAVLARRSDYELNGVVDPQRLFVSLRQNNNSVYAFYFQPESAKAFMSFSPERLYRRDGRDIQIDALSSTIDRGTDSVADKFLENQLLTDDKQCREHQQVIEGVTDQVTSLAAQPVRVGKTSVKKLDRVQHLWAPVTARLKSDVDDAEIIGQLHPTPAVGGRPVKEALDSIERFEPFDRGCYAAPCGYISQFESELAVAIRSLLVHDNIISVFAGAGIVAGSDPEREWHEIDSKDILQPLLELKK